MVVNVQSVCFLLLALFRSNPLYFKPFSTFFGHCVFVQSVLPPLEAKLLKKAECETHSAEKKHKS